MPKRPAEIEVDLVIFGGGAAGLWLLDDVTRRGFECVLIEATRLGQGQTICAQGIIHGGLKYSLDGLLGRSAKAIREMPEIWRQCLAGRRKPDLRGTRVRAEFCHLWQTESLRSKMAMFGARVGLRVKPDKLAPADRPAILASCPGTVARLAEQVIDPARLITDLADKHPERLLRLPPDLSFESRCDGDGHITAIDLPGEGSETNLRLRPQQIVLTAGAGNATLAARFGLPHAEVQRRPLHMVMMRGDLPDLNGHCVDGVSTRATITSDHDAAGRMIWQVGGQIAEDGVAMDRPTLLAHAVSEMREILPDLDLSNVEWATYRIDRAEPATTSGARPDDAFAMREANVILGWPTKLALVPRLTQQILELLNPPSGHGEPNLSLLATYSRPEVALPPWETEAQWSDTL